MKNKKGSHIGFVLSFILFITFIIFIYQILTPSVKIFGEKSEILNSFKEKVIENISEKVYTIRVYNSTPSNFHISHPDLGLSNVIGFDSFRNEIPAEISGETTIFEGGHGFITLIYNQNFIETNPSSPGTGSQIPIGNIIVEKRILESEIIKLIDLIRTDYNNARTSLDIIGNYEFDLQFKYENGTWIKTGKERDYKTNIYSKQFIVNYLNINAKEKIGEIIIRIW